MDVTMEFLDKLTISDLDEINRALRLLGEARRDVDVMLHFIRFRANESSIQLPTQNPNIREYMLYNGKWQHRDGAHTFELDVNDETVFEAYKKALKNNASPQYCAHVRAFQERARMLYEAHQEELSKHVVQCGSDCCEGESV